MNFTLLCVYLITIILMIAAPGPVVAFVLNSAVRGGFKQARLTVFGSNLASLVLIVTAAVMIMGIVTIKHELLVWISLVGCIFLAWTAIDGLGRALCSTGSTGNAHSIDRAAKEDLSRKSNRSSEHFIKSGGVKQILHGFLIGISNPKDIIFFVAFFPQFINITAHVQISLVVLAVLWILCDFLILLSYAIVVNSKRFKQQKKWISILSSGFLLVVAIGAGGYALMGLQHSIS